MSNRIAILLGIVIVVFVVTDFILFSGDAIVFLARKFMDLIEWIAFWR